EGGDLVAGPERAEGPGTRPDRVEKERKPLGRGETEAHRPRQHATRRREHEELPGDAWIKPASLDAQEGVEPDRLDTGDPKPLPPPHDAPGGIWPPHRGRARWPRPRQPRRPGW